MSFPTTIVTGLYLITLKLGLFGNCWVILSVLRTRPRNGSLTPSDRLRGYIGLLAVLDLLVTLSLAIRIVYVILPNASIDTWSCRTIFIVNDLLKLGSITCLACISIERYITIRKPFNSRVRRRLIQFTPVVALVILALVLSGIATLASNVTVRDGPTSNVGMDCTQMSSSDGYYSAFVGVARWIVALSFLLQLTTVSSNYGQIVRHVRRKFWQRKARVVANSRNSHSSNSQHKQPLVSEPRYMKDMTWAIVRIAVFHMICWLPYCLIQILPYSISLSKISTPLPIYLTTSVRMINTSSTMYDGLAWLAFIADWLTYVNSAGDWVFYAAMNRDLRSIIRQTTERRKRSTLSQQSPSSNLHRSLKRQMTQSLRFFYSINSYRSTAPNSFDESFGESQCKSACMGTPRHHNRNSCQNSPNGSLRLAPNGPQLSPPIDGVKKKISSISNQSGNSEGLFGMRNGRAHTYCSPRPVHFSVDPVTTNHRPPLIHTRCVNSKSQNSSPNTSATAAATKLQKIMAAFAIGNAHTFSNSQNKREQNLPEKLPELSPKLRKESPTPLNGILVNLPQSPSPTSRSPHSQSISSTTTTTTLLPLLGSNGHCQGSSVNNTNHYSSVTVIGALAPSRNFV